MSTLVLTLIICVISLCELFFMFILETPPPLMGNNVPKQMPTCMHYLPQPCHFHFRWIIVILTFFTLVCSIWKCSDATPANNAMFSMQCFTCNMTKELVWVHGKFLEKKIPNQLSFWWIKHSKSRLTLKRIFSFYAVSLYGFRLVMKLLTIEILSYDGKK